MPCFRCGYNLRTLQADSSCAECGYPVENSRRLSPTRRWPINAESACAWMSIGLLTLWLCGAGLVLWMIGLILLTRRTPKDNGPYLTLIYFSWGTLAGLIAAAMLPENSFGAAVLLSYILIGLALAHYCVVMLIAIRLTHDANMPVARTAGYLLLTIPTVVFPVIFILTMSGLGIGSLAGALAVGFWLLLAALFWMGLSSELGSKRHALLRAAGIDRFARRNSRYDVENR